jgi:hypothetical protein
MIEIAEALTLGRLEDHIEQTNRQWHAEAFKNEYQKSSHQQFIALSKESNSKQNLSTY